MTNKQLAKDFLTDVAEGRIDQAFTKYVDMSGRHHNIYTPAGFEALKKGMAENEAQFPNKKFEIQHIAEDGDLVMVHSKLIMGHDFPLMATLHILEFKDGIWATRSQRICRTLTGCFRGVFLTCWYKH